MTSWYQKHLATVTALMYGILLLFFVFTSPRDLPQIFLIVPIGLIFICLSLTFYLLIRLYAASRQSNKIYVYAITPSFLICLILTLKSIDQLSGRDILLVFVFIIVSSVYLSRMRISRNGTKNI
jgi:hypothetical protein